MQNNTDFEVETLADGGVEQGAASMRGIKRKLNVSDETYFEDGFEDNNIRQVRVSGRLNDDHVSTIFEFDFDAWRDHARMFTGELCLDLKFKQADNTNYPATLEAMAAHPAWLRPGFFNNLFEYVEVEMNGQSLGTVYQYDQIARIKDLMSVDARLEEDHRRRSGFGIYRDAPLLKRADGEALQEAIQNAPMTPATLPTTQVATTNATIPTVKEQSAYNELYGELLPGSNIVRFQARLKHPFMTTTKFLPPDTPLKVRVKLNSNDKLFQCRRGDVPRIEFVEARMIDRLIKMSPKVANALGQSIVKEGEFTVPITRPQLTEITLQRAKTIVIPRVLVGTVPRRIAVAFVPNSAYKSNSPTNSPYIYSYLGITKFKISNNGKCWPTQDGYEVKGVPEHAAPYNDEEIAALVRRNWTVYEDNVAIFAGRANVPKLALKAEDWFKHNNVWSFDFTPLGHVAEHDSVSFPKMVGNLDFEIEFAAEPTEVYTMIIVSEFDNTIKTTVPDMQVMKDW